MLNGESYAEYYARGAHAKFSHETRAVGRLPLRLVRASQGEHGLDDPATPELLVGLVLAGTTACRWTWGDGWNEIPNRRAGDMGLSPPNTGATFEVGGDHTILVVGIPIYALISQLDESGYRFPSTFGHLHDAYFRDATDRDICLQLWRLAEAPTALDHLAADSLLLRFACRLIEKADHGARLPRPVGKLSELQLRRVAEMIDADLETPPALRDLAGAVGLGTYQFIRCFAATFGQTPHQYILTQRISRARTKLTDKNLSIGMIAADLGFSHQSHFNRTFTRIVGCSPGKYRRSANCD